VFDCAVRDMSNLSSVAKTNLTVTEYDDITPPTITDVSIDIGTGYLTIVFDEFIKSSTFNVALFRVSEAAGSVGENTSNFSASTLLTGDGLSARFKISEQERVNAFYMSNDWDGVNMVFVVEIGAVKDLGLVDIQFEDGIAVSEIPDRFEPLLQIASIDYATGILQLTFNETVDVTPQPVVIQSRIGIVDGSGASVGILSGATVYQSDGTIITIKLTEEQRVQAIQTGLRQIPQDVVNNDQYFEFRFVGPGGDDAANVFDFYQGAIKDISLNDATEQLGFTLSETPSNTTLCLTWLRMSMSHFMMELKLPSWTPTISIPKKEGWKMASGQRKRSLPTVMTCPSGSS
jgi:hypothetical protein